MEYDLDYLTVYTIKKLLAPLNFLLISIQNGVFYIMLARSQVSYP